MHEQVHATDEMLKSIFRGALHELATPINGIAAAVRLMNENPDSPPEFRNDLLKMISISSHNLSSIHSRVAEVVKLEKLQKYKLCEAQFNFRVWLQNVISSMYPIAMSKEVKIISQVEQAFPVYLIGDKTYLTQLLYNLLNNAIMYSADASIVTITCYVTEKIFIEITDQGVGIPAEEIPYIFNEYHQVNAGAKIKGLGLGLSIVKNLVEIMGGAITVNSKAFEATTFSIQLPINIPKNS